MVCKELSAMHQSIRFLFVDVETIDGFQQKYKITTVPHFLFFKGGKLQGELDGADPAALMEKIDGFVSQKTTPEKSETVTERIEKLLSKNEVILFMKGSPSAPRCGFSSKVVNALNEDHIEFVHFDILQDEEIRQGLKDYSCWPTYPQLYAKGELIGGCDIILDLHTKGELAQTVNAKQES
eukprot:g8288.t1